MPRLKFVQALTNEQRQELRSAYTSHPEAKTRRRAHALLLSDEGRTINQLQAIFQVDRDTISIWFKRYAAQGLDGLVDLPRSGRPRIYTQAETEQLKALVSQEPRQIKAAQALVQAQTGKTACTDTFKRILKN